MSKQYNTLNLHTGPINLGLKINEDNPLIQAGLEAKVNKALKGIQLSAKGIVREGGIMQAGIVTESLDTYGLKLSVFDKALVRFSGIKIAALNRDHGQVNGIRLSLMNINDTLKYFNSSNFDVEVKKELDARNIDPCLINGLDISWFGHYFRESESGTCTGGYNANGLSIGTIILAETIKGGAIGLGINAERLEGGAAALYTNIECMSGVVASPISIIEDGDGIVISPLFSYIKDSFEGVQIAPICVGPSRGKYLQIGAITLRERSDGEGYNMSPLLGWHSDY